MDNVAFYMKYPFTQEAAHYVKGRHYTLEDAVLRPAYSQVRARARRRVLEDIAGKLRLDDRLEPELELLSYPVSRIMVAAIGDQYLMKRFALWESKRAFAWLEKETEDSVLLAVGSDLGISARPAGPDFELHFTDYLRHAAGFRNVGWKLINQKMISGKVSILRKDFARLLEEAARDRVQSGLGGKVPEAIVAALEPYLAEIRPALDRLKAEKNIAVDGEISEDAFPPCMRQLLADLQKGMNLPHTARFALTSFLANIGLDREKIMELYRMAPDFREDLTRYQVEHITGGGGTEYTAPSCKTMMTYGNCPGGDRLCEYVSHPLTYYRKAMHRRTKQLDIAPVAQPTPRSPGKG